MKCPSCSAVIDESYVASFGSAKSVSCPACGFMMETGSHDLFSTATEFKPVSGWTIRLAKGQEVHFESEEAFGQWLKQTTVTPGDMICKDGTNWESLGSYLLERHNRGHRKTQSYEVPPNTLDAPDPEDEFEELDNAIDTLDAADETSRPNTPPPIESSEPVIMQTAVGHEKRTPPPIPGRETLAYEGVDSKGLEEETADETISISVITEEEFSSEELDASSGLEDAESRTPPEQSLAPPIPETSLAPPIPEPDSVPPMPVMSVSSPASDVNETSTASMSDAVPSSRHISPPVVSPAQEGKTQGSSSSPNLNQPQQEHQSSGGGFGSVLVGAVVGAVLAVVIMKGVAPSTEISPAQRVVVTKQEAELSLEQKELLGTAERWLSYLTLNAATEPQLQSRMLDSKETTTQAKTLGAALMMTAHLVDLERVDKESERLKLIALYESRYAQDTPRFLRYAGPGLKTLGTPPSPEPQSSAAVAIPNTKAEEADQSGRTDSSSTVDGEVARGQNGTKPVEKNTVAVKASAPKERKKKASGSASYTRMLKLGTRHLENGRLSDADAALKKAAELRPKAHAPQAKLGYVALNRGQLQQALKYFKRAVDIKPRDRETLLGLGGVYEKMGRKSDAKAIYRRYQSYFKSANDRRRIEYKLEKLGE